MVQRIKENIYGNIYVTFIEGVVISALYNSL